MKKLIEQRASLLAEYDVMKLALETAKRSAFTSEEFEKVNKIKLDIEEIEKQIEVEKGFEAKRNLKLDAIAQPVFNIGKSENIVERTNIELANFLSGKEFSAEFRTSNGNFFLPNDYLKRATVTSAAASQTQQKTLPVSIIEKGLVLRGLGASLTFESGAGLKANYLSSAPATFGSEDVAVSDATYTAGSFDMVPNFVRAGYEISGLRLKQISAESVDYIAQSLQNRVYQAIEKKAIEHAISSSANVVSGSSGTTLYAAVVAQKNGIEFGNAFITTKEAATILETAKKDSQSGRFVLDGGLMLGYEAIPTALAGTANTAVFADWAHASMNIWDGIELAIVRDVVTRKGNYIIEATAYADGKFGNPYGSYVLRNINSFTKHN